MEAFGSIADLFNNFGTAINSIITHNNGATMYAFFFIAVFGISYWLIHTGINRGKFEGKPATSISVMLSIIIVGSIFFKYKNASDLTSAMGNFVTFLLNLGLAIGALTFGIKYYVNNKEKHHVFASTMMFLGLFFFTTLTLPMFSAPTGTETHSLSWFYETFTKSYESLHIIGGLLSLVWAISIIMLFWNVFRLTLGSIKGGNKRSEIGEILSHELDETSRLKSLIRNLEAQIAQGNAIVNNLRRLN